MDAATNPAVALSALEQGCVPQWLRDLAAEVVVLRIELGEERSKTIRLWDYALDREDRVAELEAQAVELRAKVSLSSANSSLPPSSDKPAAKAVNAKERRERRRNASAARILREESDEKRKRGAQVGHPTHLRPADAEPEFDGELLEARPRVCPRCKAGLDDSAPEFEPPKTEVVWDFIPEERRVKVTGWKRYSVKCPHCKRVVFGQTPGSCFGDGLAALVALLHGRLRLGFREIVLFLEECFGIRACLGSVAKLCREASEALGAKYDEILKAVQESEVTYVDETSWRNEGARAWLMTAVGEEATVYRIGPGSSHVADVDSLLGPITGERTIVSDRGKVFDHLPTGNRQICHCHLARNFKQLESYGRASAVLGKALLGQERELFRAWHAFRRAGDRDALQSKLAPVQAEMRRLLDEGSNSLVDGEFCRGVLKVWDALWRFVEREGVEPTNNEAERALRHAVVWEKTSLGTWSDWGCRFVERIESLVATSRQRGESVLRMLAEAIRAYRAGKKRRPRPTKLELQARRAAQLAVAAS